MPIQWEGLVEICSKRSWNLGEQIDCHTANFSCFAEIWQKRTMSSTFCLFTPGLTLSKVNDYLIHYIIIIIIIIIVDYSASCLETLGPTQVQCSTITIYNTIHTPP